MDSVCSYQFLYANDGTNVHTITCLEMNEHRPNAVIIDIREDMGKVRFFANGRDIWRASIA